MHVSNEQTNNIKYWKPDFRKTKLSKKEAGKNFISLLKKSLFRLTSDKKRFGVFLSGGHDSRLILSAFNHPPETFTIGFNKNYEAECAIEISKKLNSNNKFLKIEKNHFTNNIDQITRITGGQYSFYDSIFSGLNYSNFDKIDYLFHGHAIDYLFQGMYLPAEYFKILGSPIFFKKHKYLFHELSEEFINRIKYRIKGFDILKFINLNIKLL